MCNIRVRCFEDPENVRWFRWFKDPKQARYWQQRRRPRIFARRRRNELFRVFEVATMFWHHELVPR